MHQARLLPLLLTLPSALSCTTTRVSKRSPARAEVTVPELTSADFETSRMVVSPAGGSGAPIFDQTFPRGKGRFELVLEPGAYQFALHYFKGAAKVVSSDFCGESQRLTNIRSLAMGAHQIVVMICTPGGLPVVNPGDGADVKITPVKKPSTPLVGDPQRGAGLYANQCQACHGNQGQGQGAFPPLKGATCKSCATPELFAQKTDATMPLANPDSCDAQCAADIAAHALQTFK